MSSFSFTDCPTNVALTETERNGKRVSTGSLSFTVRNATKRALLGRLSVEPDDMAESGWFEIEGAPPTNAAERDMDFEAETTQTAKLKIAVPEGAPPGPKVFRLRVTTERDPDNDFADSPAVAFDVKAPAPKGVPKKPFPWWILAVAAAAVVVVGGVIWMVRPQTSQPKCPTGYDYDGASHCYLQCPTDWPGASSREFCQKKTTSSAASAPTCWAGLTLHEGLCYLLSNGWSFKSKNKIIENCEIGFLDRGDSCYFAGGMYNRGAGGAGYGSLPDCLLAGTGSCEQIQNKWYKVCKGNTSKDKTVATFCDGGSISYNKQTRDVYPVGDANVCPVGQSLSGKSCFPPCPIGSQRSTDNPSVCSTLCPSQYDDSGSNGCKRPVTSSR